MLRKSDGLLLDETIGALDAESEMLVWEALEKAGEGRPTVTFVHQVQKIEATDRVVLFERGGVAKQEAFTQLMQKNSPFLEFLRDETTPLCLALELLFDLWERFYLT